MQSWRAFHDEADFQPFNYMEDLEVESFDPEQKKTHLLRSNDINIQFVRLLFSYRGQDQVHRMIGQVTASHRLQGPGACWKTPAGICGRIRTNALRLFFPRDRQSHHPPIKTRIGKSCQIIVCYPAILLHNSGKKTCTFLKPRAKLLSITRDITIWYDMYRPIYT